MHNSEGLTSGTILISTILKPQVAAIQMRKTRERQQIESERGRERQCDHGASKAVGGSLAVSSPSAIKIMRSFFSSNLMSRQEHPQLETVPTLPDTHPPPLPPLPLRTPPPLPPPPREAVQNSINNICRRCWVQRAS